MSHQPTLPVAGRDHDLPPLWDGHPVKWGTWRPALHFPTQRRSNSRGLNSGGDHAATLSPKARSQP